MRIMMKPGFLTFFILLFISSALHGQTAKSLFRLSDSLQVAEVVSDIPCIADELGHGGPAVENSHMALRMMFDDSGSIDVYSKNARGMELLHYLWHTTPGQQDSLYVGTDAYVVGETLGLGGVALWDGKDVVRLAATKGRSARVGETGKGAYMEMISYGVPYDGGYVDISVRIDVSDKSRIATVTAAELTGRKIMFVTGVNHHPGQKVMEAPGVISVWGPHPAGDASFPIGGGMFYSSKLFPSSEKTEDMVRLISKPVSKMSVKIISASTMEAELNNAKRFESFMSK